MTPEVLSSVAIFLGIALGTLIGVPASPLYAAAGVIWGLSGFPLMLLAMTLHLVVGYFLTKTVARPVIEKILKKFKNKISLSAFDAKKLGPIKITLFIRMLPAIPLCVKTYGLSIMEIPFWSYFIPSLIIELLWALGYALAGEAFIKGQWMMFAGAAAFILLLIILTKIFSRRKIV
jgi:uncharacterized membrane protein YdjX (TVP38/TMEM64 family)